MNYTVSNLNLNMLIVLDAVCRLKSTVKASEEINISQPAVSRYLKQLRELTRQELFVRTSSGLEPTQGALDLWEKAVEVLELCEFFTRSSGVGFDPKIQKETFTIALPIINTGIFIEQVILHALENYPQIRINLIGLHMSSALEKLESRDIDLYIGFKSEGLQKSFDVAPLTDIDFRVICSDKCELYQKGRISKSEFVSLPHIKVAGEINETFLDRELKRLNVLQKSIVAIPDTDSMIVMLRNTNKLFIATERQANSLCQRYSNIKILKTDFDLPSIPIHQIWRRVRTPDPAHSWLRDYIEKRIRLLSDT